MNYCIVNPETTIIENMIVCKNDETAQEFGAVPSYAGARIGAVYAPPPPPEPLPTPQEDTDALMVDHEYRLTLLELGVTEGV